MPSAVSSCPVRTVRPSWLPPQPAPPDSEEPSASTARSICSAERLRVPSVITAAARLAVPALPAPSAEAPRVERSVAVTSGRRLLVMVMIRSPLASCCTFGVGTGGTISAPGAGGATRCASGAGWTISILAGATSGAAATVSAVRIVSPVAPFRISSGR